MATFNDLLPQKDFVDNGDTLPAERSYTKDAGVYPVQIDMAYMITTFGGSKQLMVNFQEYPFKGYTIKQKLILTSGKAKGCKNYFVDQDGNQRKLPGMANADDMAELITGRPLGQLEFTMKKVPIYDFEQRKEMLTDVLVAEDLLQGVCQIALTKIQENKRVKTEDGDWIDTNEPADHNEIDKVFSEDGRTLTEVRAEEPKGEYLAKWVKAKAGKVIDRYKPIPGGATPGAPAAAKGATPAPAATPGTGTTPLFE